MKTKGQNLRFAVEQDGERMYIASAQSFDLNVQCDTEEDTSKDSDSGWKEYEATLKSWSGSGTADYILDTADEGVMNADDIMDALGKTLPVFFDITGGEKNRTLQKGKYTGDAIITEWKISSQNATKVTVDFSFQGTGKLGKQPAPESSED